MSKRLRCTAEQVMSWEPCEDYTEEVVRRLFGRRKYLDARQILALDIPAGDRLWAALREEVIPAPLLHEFACREAHSALMRERRAGREPDERLWNAISVKRRWLRGQATDDDLAAAWDAAGEAAWDAAWDAAGAAAWAAASAAAWAAARAASIRRLLRLLDSPPKWLV